eukprot:TRINITY_DN29185_c0_g1_i1.p1 TRINITY_DN29185_c0_g1~~TRINITY_DN29185_c0_g1_i1.p1  ORF type:complete len:219 (-),score=47.92 TRINITY_DN29185_c0_g1_i1:742-1326(-)
MASGSARAAVLAIRHRSSSRANSRLLVPDAEGSRIQTSQQLASSKGSVCSFDTTIIDAECLLEDFMHDHDSDSESSDGEESSDGAPKRTASSPCMENLGEFVNFVNRRLTRDYQCQQAAYESEAKLPRVSDPKVPKDAEDMLSRFSFLNFDEGYESESDVNAHVCRSPRVSHIPDASEYLTPLALHKVLESSYK